MAPKQKKIVEVVVLAGIGVLLWWSVTQILVWTRERQPLEITCADYLSQRPDAHWVRLTQCDADVEHAAVLKDLATGKVNAVYIPLHSQGSKAPAFVMLESATTQPAVQGPFEGTIGGTSHRAEILNMNLGIDSGFVVLTSGGRPSSAAGLAGLLFGLFAAGWILWDLFRRPGEKKPKPDKRLSLNLR